MRIGDNIRVIQGKHKGKILTVCAVTLEYFYVLENDDTWNFEEVTNLSEEIIENDVASVMWGKKDLSKVKENDIHYTDLSDLAIDHTDSIYVGNAWLTQMLSLANSVSVDPNKMEEIRKEARELMKGITTCKGL